MKSELCIGIFILCTFLPCLVFSQDQNSIPLWALDKRIFDEGSYLESEAGISAYGMVALVFTAFAG
jgi:hypothetical protein